MGPQIPGLNQSLTAGEVAPDQSEIRGRSCFTVLKDGKDVTDAAG